MRKYFSNSNCPFLKLFFLFLELFSMKPLEQPQLHRTSPDFPCGWHITTQLHEAASSDNIEFAQLFLQHNSDIEARDEYNLTPLHIASFKNSKEVAELLLQHNADIDAKGPCNRTSFHFAAYVNNIEIAPST